MRGAICRLILLRGIISVSCLTAEEAHQQHRHSQDPQNPYPDFVANREIWSPRDVMEPYIEQIAKHSKWTQALGYAGNLTATIAGVSVTNLSDTSANCGEDSYTPSELEKGFSANVIDWTKDETSLCEHLHPGLAGIWLWENALNQMYSGNRIWSQLCKKGSSPQLIEPLAGILRHPSPICDGYFPKMLWIEHLVLADQATLTSPSTKLLFDAGGGRFKDTTEFLALTYERKGIDLDKIVVWEADSIETEAYWSDVDPEVRKKWEPRLHLYSGVAVTQESDHKHNLVKRLVEECKVEDFCAVKLDTGDPELDLGIVQQLLKTPAATSVLDEFFYEHKVRGENAEFGWDDRVMGEAYEMFTELRKAGVRAHPWI